MNWELIIKLVIALGTVAIGAMQLRAKLVDDRREREYRQRRDQEERERDQAERAAAEARESKDRVDNARHDQVLGRIGQLDQSIGTVSTGLANVERRIEAFTDETRKEIKQLHEQDRRQIAAIARLEGRIGMRSDDGKGGVVTGG